MQSVFLEVLVLTAMIGATACLSIGEASRRDVHAQQGEVVAPGPAKDSGAQGRWQPAVFEGLEIGKSSRSDAIMILGTPDMTSFSSEVDMPDDYVGEKYLIDVYNERPFWGKIEVWSSTETGIIELIDTVPDGLRVSEVVERFGKDFVRKRYELLKCPGDSGSSAIIESIDGNIKHLEYPQKGITIYVDDAEEKVLIIEFVSKPIGATTRDCEELRKQR